MPAILMLWLDTILPNAVESALDKVKEGYFSRDSLEVV
jgi:hypothetical protein